MGCASSAAPAQEEDPERIEAWRRSWEAHHVTRKKAEWQAEQALLAQLDARTKVPHLLVELRSVGFVEICGKNVGGIYEKLEEWLRQSWGCVPMEHFVGSEVQTFRSGWVKPALLDLEEWDKLCDANFTCGVVLTNGRVRDNEVFHPEEVRGNTPQWDVNPWNKFQDYFGDNNMGLLTMKLVNFMTNVCGWSLQLANGGNLGTHGQLREQQVKFRAPHPLNLIAPHMMVELRRAGFIEINNAPDDIAQKLGDWLSSTWGAYKCEHDPNICDIRYFAKNTFKNRGEEGENNMGKVTMQLVDFMVKKCAWTLITCNGGNFGWTGQSREQQLIFRDDKHVSQGRDHCMIELRTSGYVEVNGLENEPDAFQALDRFVKETWKCTDYKSIFQGEKFCGHKYKDPAKFLWQGDWLANNLGRRTIELSTFMASQGWMLLLCNGGAVVQHVGSCRKIREQQVVFTKAQSGEKTDLPMLMVELRTQPTNEPMYWPHPADGDTQWEPPWVGYIEVNGPNTNGVHEKLEDYIRRFMKGYQCVEVDYCDVLFRCGCLQLRDRDTYPQNWRGGYWDAQESRLSGESNFGRYTMRLCDFFVDHLGEWDLVVCNGVVLDQYFREHQSRSGKHGLENISWTAREQQLVFRHRPGGRTVFMADAPKAAALGRPPVEVPSYWTQASRAGISAHEIIHVSTVEKCYLQELLDGTFKNKATRDRKDGKIAERFVVVQAVRSECPVLWDKYARRRAYLRSQLSGQLSERPAEWIPKTWKACSELASRCEGGAESPTNEAYLLHGSNPTSAMSILGTSFSIDFAGASAGTMFGPGVYLAEASSKADEYAKDDLGGPYEGLYASLVCRAVLGRPYVVQHPGDYRNKVLSGEFDCIIGDREAAVGTYREFILFNEDSIYPEYAVFYRRE